MNGVQIRIRGKVQGVGFRPFVWQLARQMARGGNVCNDGDGVLVRLTGDDGGFSAALARHCPPLARIDSTDCTPFHWHRLPQDFTIRHSDGGSMRTQIVPDAATCPACLAEMNDPQERRYRYPFINCTHCGPRFTIIRAMPYDRPFTAMAPFPLCPRCAAEYRQPADRRFHAQPVACADCGPQLEWRAGTLTLFAEAALQAAIARLAAGDIVAIKGIGGFHLACDAGNSEAVAALRARKRRPAKPLAVMLPTATGLPAAAATLLRSPAAPIVLLAKAQVPGLCDEIASGLAEVGVMLPSNPLQHLLLQALARPIVMTSGNLSGRPPALSNHEALTDLAAIADGFLLHNRDIVQRMDDSLVRSSGEMLRRARGYVPDALPLPPGLDNIPPLLALGADMKNTFCLARGDEAVLSQHFGDLGEEGVEQQWRSALRLMQSIYAFAPQRVAVDAHPGYRSTRWAASMSLPVEPVLHHHAHAAACLAEHRWPLDGGDVIALTLDGIGMGENGALWGGECLRRELPRMRTSWRPPGRSAAGRQSGGAPAVAQPAGPLPGVRSRLAVMPGETADAAAARTGRCWRRPFERGHQFARCASSCGRLFDAVACALGCAPHALSYGRRGGLSAGGAGRQAVAGVSSSGHACPGCWRSSWISPPSGRQWLALAGDAQRRKPGPFTTRWPAGHRRAWRVDTQRASCADRDARLSAAACCTIALLRRPPHALPTRISLCSLPQQLTRWRMAQSPTGRRWWPPPAGWSQRSYA